MTEKEILLLSILPEFADDLTAQLESDDERYGETWRYRLREGQEERIFADIDRYADQFRHGGQPVPWLKVAGLALIGWAREHHPEFLLEAD